jgi:hypothetical protein
MTACASWTTTAYAILFGSFAKRQNNMSQEIPVQLRFSNETMHNVLISQETLNDWAHFLEQLIELEKRYNDGEIIDASYDFGFAAPPFQSIVLK